MAFEAIVGFLALQDALFSGTSINLPICAVVKEIHAIHGVTEVAPCHYFSSRAALSKHIAHGLPVDAKTAECREFISTQNSLSTVEKQTEITHLVRACTHDTYPIYYSTENINAVDSCAKLSTYHNMSLSRWSTRMVEWDKYTCLGANDDALANVCYASPDVLDEVVTAGKAIDKTLKKMLQASKVEVDRFIAWYKLQPF